MWMPDLRSARSTGWTSAAVMMKSPSTAASASLPEKAAQVVSPIEPPTLVPCIAPSRPIVTFTTPSCVSALWPRTASTAAAATVPALGTGPAKRVAGCGLAARPLRSASSRVSAAAVRYAPPPASAAMSNNPRAGRFARFVRMVSLPLRATRESLGRFLHPEVVEVRLGVCLGPQADLAGLRNCLVRGVKLFAAVEETLDPVADVFDLEGVPGAGRDLDPFLGGD